MVDKELEFTESEVDWNWYVQQVIFKGLRLVTAAKTSGVETMKLYKLNEMHFI